MKKSNTAIDTNNPLIKLAMDLTGKTVRFFGRHFAIGKIVFEPGKNEGEKPSLLIQLFANEEPGKHETHRQSSEPSIHESNRISGKTILRELFAHLAGESANLPEQKLRDHPGIQFFEILDITERCPGHVHAAIKVEGIEYSGCGKSETEALAKALLKSQGLE